jgi:hypothetical protein
MDLSEVAFIPGMPGLFRIVSRRNDGAIATSLVDGKTQFFSSRTHFMSPLDSITIYTNEDSVRLKDVLATIHKAGDKIPFPKNDDKDLKRWMEAVLPDYDKEKVHVSDMKKLAKWSSLLAEKKLLEELTAEKEGEENKEELKEKKESKPKVVKSDASSKAHSKPAPVKKITTPRKAT